MSTKVQIDRITNRDEYQPQGKKFKITTFTCDGYIDGNPVNGFLVKAIGKDKTQAVVPGFVCDMDIDNYGGKVKYEIPRNWTPSQAPAYTAPPPPQQAGRPAQTAKGPAPAGGLSMDEFDKIFTHGMDVVSGKMIELKRGAENAATVEGEAFSKLVATYVIAAMDNGVRMPKTAEAVAAEEAEKPVDMHMVLEVLDKKGLTKRVDDAGLTEEDLVNMWKASGDSPLKFGMLVTETLKRRESGETDNLPF